jgi:hypothetical protein
MDPHFRKLYNEHFTQERYAWFQRELARRLNCTFEFRLAETPLFLTDDFKAQAVKAAREIVDQLSNPSLLAKMKSAIPPQWNVPKMDALPNVTQVDFAIVDANGRFVPKLIELQGFPSLTALQTIKRDVYSEMMQSIPGLDIWWSCWFSGFDRDGFLDLARRTIVGKQDPREVILMDIDPPNQKTYPDFAATKLLFDVDAVDPLTLVKRGKKLFRADGTPVKRIYNRIVFDELIQKNIQLPFDYREELDVEWMPHPNWYWTWSKFSLPFLNHPTVPKATFVSELDRVPDDLSRYVLKPLFSFAGGGVNVDPTPADIAAIPANERSAWCIQEKIEYAQAIQAADGGGVKAEVRMMFYRPDDEPKMILGQNLARLSRGKLLGVDFNKTFTWVGSSVALSPSS